MIKNEVIFNETNSVYVHSNRNKYEYFDTITFDKFRIGRTVMFEVYADENAKNNIGLYHIVNLVANDDKSLTLFNDWNTQNYRYLTAIINYTNNIIDLYRNGIFWKQLTMNSDYSKFKVGVNVANGQGLYFNFGQKEFIMEKPSKVISVNEYYNSPFSINNVDMHLNTNEENNTINFNINYDNILDPINSNKLIYKVYKNDVNSGNLIKTEEVIL